MQIESAGGGAKKKDGGQKLLFLPDNTTDAKWEYRRYYSNEESLSMPPETFYVYSKVISAEGQGYLKSTSKTLAANKTEKLSFQFYATDTYLDTEDTIYEAGSLDVQVNPGMVVPDDITTLVDIHTKQTVDNVVLITEGKTADIAPTNVSGDHKVYSIKFNNQGRNDVKITYDGNKESVLQFWVTDSVNEAMQAHVDFLMTKLRITDRNDRHYGSFNEYNNVTNTVLTKVGDECSNNNYEQMYDGPAFIAEKQVYYPVQNEIDAMDVYLIDLVYAKELVKDESSVHYGRLYYGCEEPGFESYGNDASISYNGYTITSRIFNYFRICNTFYSMYKAAAYYGDSLNFRWEPTEYLYWAGMLAAWGEEISDGYWGPTGAMGEQTVPDIIDALNKEGITDVANRLKSAAEAKGNSVARQAFPFGSEFSVDRTGEEGAYFLSKLIGSETSQIKAINKIMAWISKTPTWYQQTTGRTNDSDWWIFQYTVSLQAAAMKDWYMTHEKADAYWSMIYPAAFSSFAHIKTSNDQESNGPIGTVWWNYWPTRPYNWDGTATHSGGNWPSGQTGEADIDLWGGMQLLSTDVVLDDPSFGLTAYGGTAVERDGKIIVTPQDGLYTNLNVVGMGAEIELQSDKYTKAQLTIANNKFTAVTLSLNNFLKTAHEAELTVSGLAEGAYQVTVNGSRQMIINVADGAKTTVVYQVGKENAELTIEPYEKHEGNLKVALVGDAALAGKGTSNWTENGMAAQLEPLLKTNQYEVQTYTGNDSGIETFNPDMVVLMTESVTDYGAQLEKYQKLPYAPIVYAVTTGNKTVSESIRTAAGEKGAVLIDAWDLINEQPDLVQDGALNNNGVRELVGVIYNTVAHQIYSVPLAERNPYAGIDAVDFDRQSGAHYADVRETADSTNEPYVHIDAHGYIGFEGLELDKITAGITLTAGFDGDGILQVYTGNPNHGGKLVGQIDVKGSANGAAILENIVVAMSVPNEVSLYAADGSASSDLLELNGRNDIYLKPSVGMDVKTVTMTELSTPYYQHDFSYDDGRWENIPGENLSYNVEDYGVDLSQHVYWIDDEWLGLIKDLAIKNFLYEFDYALYDGEDTGGVVFRVTGHNGWEPNGLGVLFDAGSDKILVVSMPGKDVIAAFDYEVRENDWRHVAIRVYGNTIEVYGDDNQMIGTVTDNQITAISGRAGVWSDGESIDFTNFNIRAMTEGAPVIVTNPVDVITNETRTAVFTVEAQPYTEGDVLTYQWQKSIDEVNWEDISGANETSYTTPALEIANDDGMFYRVTVTANGNSETSTVSAAVKLTVLPLPVVERVAVAPGTASVRVGGSQFFTAEVTGLNNPDLTVTWTLTGGSDAEGTYVREDGTLFVSEKETVGTVLTVTATSVYDVTKSAEASVTVTAALTKDDIVLHYMFDEVSGNTVTDYSKNKYDGTITGNTTTAWTEDGYAFDGSSHLIAGENADLVSSDMTLVYKLKRTGNINLAASLFWGMPYQNYAGSGIWLNISGRTPLYVAANGANSYQVEGWDINSFYTANDWVEVAVSVNSAGELAIYRNGELVGRAAGKFVTPSGNDLNSIGMAGYDNEFLNNVTMGEYIIFNEALSESEVKAVLADKFKPESPVGPQEPVYTGITITPAATAARTGSEVIFTSRVSGRYLPEDAQDVMWELTGNVSQDTTLANGVLKIAADETVETLTVKVTSVKAPELFAEATVTVVQPVTITKENIVLHYIFDEGEGNTIIDYSKNGYDGLMNGNANWTGDGFAFDVGNEEVPGNYIELPDAELVSSNMTIVYRLKRTADNIVPSSIFWGKSASGWNQEGIWANISSPVFVDVDGWNPFSVGTPEVNEFYPMDEWTEVAFTVNSVTHEWAIYRNGVLVGNGAGENYVITPPSNPANMIGSAGTAGNEQLHGVTMNKFMIFNESLSAEDAKAVYEGKFDPSTEPPHVHELTHVEAKAATCTEPGNIEYWYCTKCGKYFADEDSANEINEADTIIPALGHDLIHVAATEPTETEPGSIEYWYCAGCGKYFADAAALHEITLADTVIPALGHRHVLSFVEAKEATYDEEGNIAYWYCQSCEKYFRDENCTEEITKAETIIPRLVNDWPFLPTWPSTPSKPSTPSTPDTPSTPTTPDQPMPGQPTQPTEPGLPVSTGDTTEGDTVVTETTAIPETVVEGDSAVSTVSEEIGQEIVNQAVQQNSDTVIIAPEMTGNETRTEVSIPAGTVGEIASQTDANLQIATSVANVTIPNQALAGLAANGGHVTVAAERTGNTVEVTVSANGSTVESVSGGITVNIPQENCTPGTVAMLVNADGTTTVIRQSVVGSDGQSVTLPLNGSAKVVIMDNSTSFSDVPASNWAADAVAFVTSRELMKGTGDGVFDPNMSMTRAMLATVLHNLEYNVKAESGTSFDDVTDGAWYTEAVDWAASKGIITGYADGSFGPNDPITREQLAVMLYRYAGSPAGSATELNFVDANQVSGYAQQAIAWAVANGVMNGKGDGVLDPQGTAARTEVAQMLMNFVSRNVK